LPPVGGPKPQSNNSSGSYPSQTNNYNNNNNNNNNYYNNYNNQNRNANQNNKLNVDKDESGFYKARQPVNNNNSNTIPDNRNMYVDMPVDYKKSNQVIHVRKKGSNIDEEKEIRN
jgi:hypothetical protein